MHGVNLVFAATLATIAHSVEPTLLPHAPACRRQFTQLHKSERPGCPQFFLVLWSALAPPAGHRGFLSTCMTPSQQFCPLASGKLRKSVCQLLYHHVDVRTITSDVPTRRASNPSHISPNLLLETPRLSVPESSSRRGLAGGNAGGVATTSNRELGVPPTYHGLSA